MSFIHNIQSVAKYESKILIRSWFFRVFAVLSVVILGFFNFITLISDDNGGGWILKAIPSNIPYINLLLLNTGQAVIAIFLSSEFLKRDKKLDTSEVFYVRPLSNAEYVIGKIWGNLRVFLILNLLVMGLTLGFNFMSVGTPVDLPAYFIYLLLICIPTLLYIIGLSIFLMLLLKNQALTFILLLGYIGLTLFYIGDKYYYLFDYMAYNLPMFKSSIVGFTNQEALINHRGIYLFAGLAFIFFTIFLFKRLPNSSRSHYPWLILSLCMFFASGAAGYTHVHSILQQEEQRVLYTAINNKYVHTPKMIIERYDISVEQLPESFTSEVEMEGVALDSSSVFTFCLNPGLQIKEVKTGESTLDFERDNQIILIDFGEKIAAGDTVSFSINYEGRIEDTFCYLDIPAKVLQEKYQKMLFSIDKQYSFQTKDFLLFTPETYWYPRPGTGYSDQSPDWQQTYFSRFTMKVKTLSGLTPLSQGEGRKDKDGTFTFSPDYPYQSVSLIIGNYKQKSMQADSTLYSVWYIDGHDYFTAAFDSISDTIPGAVRNVRESLERSYKLSYPFNRFSVIEVPAQFTSYIHSWSQSQETVQPEMVLFPEKGCTLDHLDFVKRQRKQLKWAKQSGREINKKEAQIRTLNDFLWIFTQTEGNYDYSSGSRGTFNITTQANPYFLFPQLYNFRYNIFSPEWPIANRVIELYIQKKSDNNGWEREINGISNNEKANLLMERKSFKELLTDVEHRDLLNNIISLKGYRLFAVPEINSGIKVFRDTLYTVLERNTFRNIQFEDLLDTLGRISRADIRAEVSEWNSPISLPYYTIAQPEVIKISTRNRDVYQLKVMVANNSDYNGIIHLNIQSGAQQMSDMDPLTSRKITLDAHQAKLLVSIWDDAPRGIDINTLISGNLPNTINMPIVNVREERGRDAEREGDFIVSASSFDVEGELIVDNEDSLFSLSEPDVVGLLPKWLDKVGDVSFKYAGVSPWRAPLQWTARSYSWHAQ